MADMVELIKRLAVEAVEATKPACVYTGTVTKASPLKIKISDKLTLTKDNLIVAESLTDQYIYVNVEKDNKKTSYNFKVEDSSKKTKKASTGITVSGEGVSYNDPEHEHEMPDLEFEKIEITKAKIKVFNALKKGDEVALLRLPGGQKFYVMDRTVRADDTD